MTAPTALTQAEQAAEDAFILARSYLHAEVVGRTERVRALAQLLEVEARARYGQTFKECTPDARDEVFQALLLRAARRR